ncbi:translocation/assembly module TamB domain-containing protein [Pelomonas sp. V22]|uniref:translocation/assembly module TamB domain-containing protein n=1 Tax=Pelomonas sp. V22 TaxID=2822139 RepID=UPI0024A7A845|nr:translocation/assembly module TamB domain-containing protein [Pelomonas sp. V22]MDI4634019.1 translocation/assembly module TamB domain-containing protein [Pelomonas sp. V22]
MRRTRWLIGTALAVPVLTLTTVLGAYGLASTESGSAWLLARLPGVQVQAPQGSLLGSFSARQVHVALPGGDSLDLRGLRWQDLTLGVWARRLTIASLEAERLAYQSAPKVTSTPLQAPADLRLPLELAVARVSIGELVVPGLEQQPLREISGALSLGTQHRLQLKRLHWDRLTLAGELQLGADSPLPLQGQVQLKDDGTAGRPWEAQATLSGQLSSIATALSLQAEGQSLRAQAQVLPFAAWPLAALQAQVERLDLAALYSQAPRTALTGQAELKASGWQQPAQLLAHLSNGLAGRWDQGRLPLRTVQLSLQAPPQHPDQLQLQSLELELGDGRAAAGRVSAQGRHAGDGSWQIDSRIRELRSAELDGRLAALRWSGSLQASGQGLAGAMKLQAQLEAQFEKAANKPPLQLRLAAEGNRQQVHLSELLLQAGGSQLQAQGDVQLSAAWKLKGSARLQSFDPRLLWAGTAGSAWQRGEHGLSAEAQIDLQAAPAGQRWPLGTARLELQPSRLQGQALQGQADYQASAGSAPRLVAQISSGENRVQAEAQPGNAQVELQAPRLAAFAPLLALWQPEARLAGSLLGKLKLLLDAELRPSAVSGELQGRDLLWAENKSTASEWRITQLNLQGEAGSTLDAPLRLQLQAQGMGQGAGHQVGRALLDLQGSWARHQARLELDAQLALTPALQSMLGESGKLASKVRASLQAGFDALPQLNSERGLRWQGSISELLLRPARPEQPAWVSSQGALGFELGFERGLAAGPSSLRLQPGRIEVGGAALAWRRGEWQPAGALQADIQLEPLAVAPLLRRWQPDFGWGGDLVIVGQIKLRSSPKVEIDIELLRERGDLSVTDERGPQQLGLDALRLALQARDGRWQFHQALGGSSLGLLGATVTLQADPQALWPGPKSSLEGMLQANVANVGLWGRWVPPGWRVGGALTAGLALAGTLEAPQLLGQAEGQKLSLRNPLLGVDVRDADFLLKLVGERAELVRFLAHGPEGQITASGQAVLGEKPQAQLQIKAEGLTLLNRVDRRAQISGEAKLALAEQSLELDGRIKVDSALFDFSRGDAPSLDDDVQVIRPQAASAPAAAQAPAKPRKVRIDLAMDAGDKLQLRGRGFESRLAGELKLVQRDASTRLTGSLRTVGGTYAAYGQKLEIEKGELIFTGPYDNPRLDVLALRPNTDVSVGVALTGTALAPRIKLYADPDMSDTDKLSWLLLGRAPEGLGRADTAVLQRAALALLSGEGESPSGRLMKNLGLDELSLSQNDEDARGTVVRLGKQLSRRWYVGYERGLNATTGSWQLVYRIAQRFTLRAQSGDDNAVDLIWLWRWR